MKKVVSKIGYLTKTNIRIFLLLCVVTQLSFSQDKELEESEQIKFQELFFDALTDKAIFNYRKAIDKLDQCNAIFPDNVSVLFELSKNYKRINMLPESTLYAYKALKKDTKNLWILQHLVSVYRNDRNFKEAIEIQKIINKFYPKQQYKLVYLHLQNKDKKSAVNLLNLLESQKMLTPQLGQLKEDLFKVKASKVKPISTNTKTSSINELKKVFEDKNSYTNLKNLLTKLEKEKATDFFTYSSKGVNLFPAQPYVYLMNGIALNRLKKYKEAILNFENGIEFVVDDKRIEKVFLQKLINTYKTLEDLKNATKYQKKLKLIN